MAELTALLTPEGLRLLDERLGDARMSRARCRGCARPATPPSSSRPSSARRGCGRRPGSKFGDFADRMLFTAAGLEQATRLPVAALHAGRFRDAGIASGRRPRHAASAATPWASAASASTCSPSTPTRSPRRWPPTTSRRSGRGSQVRHAQRRGRRPDGRGTRVWLDPARRTAGHTETTRLTRSEDYSPSLDWAFGLAASRPLGMKLGPGLRPRPASRTTPRRSG